VPAEPDLSVPTLPEIFVLGDAALLPGPEKTPLPGLAAVGLAAGIVCRLSDSRTGCRPGLLGPFVYRDRGNMATIGRSAAMADFGTIQITGQVIYLLIGFRNRSPCS
jgi:NADH:ubiquinone reductase (H+-translocating)